MTPQDYSIFCISNKNYYDIPDYLDDKDSRFDEKNLKISRGWVKQKIGLSISQFPFKKKYKFPPQGWKIHISATPENASEVLDIVAKYCYRNECPFKFIRSKRALRLVNSKYWNRSASGKFITIYPFSEAEFEKNLNNLNRKLKSFEGPYILSDIRYKRGPVFARYGAFKANWILDEEGVRHPGIYDQKGRLILEDRRSVFSVPNFIKMPDLIKKSSSSIQDSLEDFPYSFEGALHFSNGGGVYFGHSVVEKRKVVIREGRPYSGLDSRGVDSKTRIKNEFIVLKKLEKLNCTPKPLHQLSAWENEFLVESFIEGSTLLDEVIRRFPLVNYNVGKEKVDEYSKWISNISEKLRKLVSQIHFEGFTIGDLHPSNILVTPESELKFVDLECAEEIGDGILKPALGAQGFTSEEVISAVQSDWQAVHNIELMLMAPIVQIVGICKAKKWALLDFAQENFPNNKKLCEELKVKNSTKEKDSASIILDKFPNKWAEIRKLIGQGIIESQFLGRGDILFPGDPRQFKYGGGSFAYGAAGVLYCLKSVFGEVPNDSVRWIIQKSKNELFSENQGFFSGFHGVSYALNFIGEQDAAVKLLQNYKNISLPKNFGFFSGRSGIALNLLFFGQILKRQEYLDDATIIAEGMANYFEKFKFEMDPITPGLLNGASGPALMFIRFYEFTGNKRYLELAKKCLLIDLGYGKTLEDGAFHVNFKGKYLIYFDGGSAGIGLVIKELLKIQKYEEFFPFVAGIRNGCKVGFTAQAGLFQGKASQLAFLSHLAVENEYPDIIKQAKTLRLHGIMHDNNICFPGTRNLRLSSDFATGASGILLVLNGIFNKHGCGIPFFSNNFGVI